MNPTLKTMFQLPIILCLATSLCFGLFCSTVTPSPTGTTTTTTTAATGSISGQVVYHSMDKLATQNNGVTPSYTSIQTEAISQDVMTTTTPTTLVSQALDTTGCSATVTCKWNFSALNLSSTTKGLAASLKDTRTSGQLWVTTYSEIASTTDVTAILNGTLTITNAATYLVSYDAVNQVLNTITGLTGTEMLNRGLIFGLIYSDKPATGSGTPTIGASVVANSPGYTIVYPNGTFSAANGAAQTATQGAFIAYPTASGVSAPATLSFTVTPPSGDTTHQWSAAKASYLRTGAIYFHILIANI